MRSSTDSYGIVLRDKDTSSYFGITQVVGVSYLTDSSTYSNYFIKGDGANAWVRGTLTATKITADEIDPVYTIGGTKYATYVASIAGGLKEEVTGIVRLNSTYIIDFKNLEIGSDLWLFYQITDFGSDMEKLQVFLTPSFDGKVWYEKNPEKNTLIIHGDSSGEVSYRFIANRFDWTNRNNYYMENNTDGLIVPLK